MRRALKLIAVGSLLLVAILALAVAIQYQLRMRLLVQQPVVVGFSKGAWVECLASTELVGHVHAVQLGGIVVTDMSGSFTSANLHAPRANGQQVCGFLGISVVDAEAKRYYIPFRYIGGLKMAENNEWFWTNPFAT